MPEVLDALVLANIAAAAAVVVVLAVRLPARHWFGPRVAYGLWALPLLAAAATLLPARVVIVPGPVMAAAEIATAPGAVAALPTAATPAPLELWPLALGLWIAGVAASLVWLAWRQAAFTRADRAGLAGPAAVGVIRPRIVTPTDFDTRYTERERRVVLAHEAAHIARHDPRINALVAVARCVNWFNPAIHLMAHVQRIDQELACDAAVVAAYPNARRAYAEAMLKTQMAFRPPPLGCAWLAPGDHPLAERVRLLAEPGPGRGQRRAGVAVVVLMALTAGGAAWAGKPANFVAAEPSLSEPMPAARPKPARKADAPAPSAQPAVTGKTVIADAPAAGVDALAGAVEVEADGTAQPVVATEPMPPARRIYAAAKRSRVERGTAVRVVASYIDPEGRPLMTDLTSFGSQHYFRVGSFIRSGSRQVLFTSVRQDGELFWVTAALNRNFEGPEIGTIALRSGETRDLVLGDGQVVTVSATARPETADEMADAAGTFRRLGAEIERSSNFRWDELKAQEASERVRAREARSPHRGAAPTLSRLCAASLSAGVCGRPRQG